MATWSVVADIDTYLDNFQPDINFGSSENLLCSIIIVGGEKSLWFRTIMNFDLSGFPGAVADITSAKLTVDVIAFNNSGELVRFERCTRPDTWREMEATWIDYRTGDAWTASGGDLTQTDRVTTTVPASGGVKDITGFKTLVEDAINNRSDILSIIMRMDDEADAGDTRQMSIRSSEDPEGTKPTLEITYGAITRPPDYRRRRMTV